MPTATASTGVTLRADATIPRRSLGLLLSFLALTGCGHGTDSAARRADVLGNLSDKVITPAYVELERSTAALASKTSQLCADKTQTSLRATRAAWIDAWQAWNRTRAFRFGPLTDTRATADIAFMADRKKIDKLLAEATAGPPVTASSISERGADVRGLEASEHVLFARDPLDRTACAYARAVAELVARSTHKVRLAWTEGSGGAPAFQDQLAAPDRGVYRNTQVGVESLVNGLSMALTESTRELASAKTAPPAAREDTGSRGGRRLRDELGSVRASYFGATSGTTGAGVSDLVAAISPTTDKHMIDVLERADDAVAALPASLADASAAELTDVYELFRNAGTIVRTEVASQLGVTLGLGDADGDS